MNTKMKLIIATIILLLILFSDNISAQDAEISLPRSVAEKALKSIELVPKLEAENEELKKLVKELESAKLTPCVVAINSYSIEYLKLPMPADDNSKVENKEILRTRKRFFEVWKRSIQAQCGWKESPKWYQYLIQLSPVFGAIITKF